MVEGVIHIDVSDETFRSAEGLFYYYQPERKEKQTKQDSMSHLNRDCC